MPEYMVEQTHRLRVPWPRNNRNEAALLTQAFQAQINIGVTPMIGWAITFLVIALIAALLGFGGIAGVAIEAAKIVFFVAIVLFLIAAVVGIVRGRRPTLP
jgi:uncharacterized membrane protein YtjA (UPF0391 family)